MGPPDQPDQPDQLDGQPVHPAAAERRVGWLAVGLAGLATGLGLLGGIDFAASVAAGGLIAVVNYGALSWIVDRVAQPSPRRGTKLAVLGFGLRYALLGGALYVIFAVWDANVVAVSLGLSAPVAAIFFEWVFEAYEGRAQG